MKPTGSSPWRHGGHRKAVRTCQISIGQWIANTDRVRNPLKIENIVEAKIRSVHRATIWRAAGRAANQLLDQAVLDAEHHVGAEIVIACDEHMRHELFEAGVRRLPTPPESLAMDECPCGGIGPSRTRDDRRRLELSVHSCKSLGPPHLPGSRAGRPPRPCTSRERPGRRLPWFRDCRRNSSRRRR